MRDDDDNDFKIKKQQIKPQNPKTPKPQNPNWLNYQKFHM